MNLTAIQAEQQRIKHIVNNIKQKQEHIEPTQKNFTSSTKKVILFSEDSSSGYDFIKSFIKICYPSETIDIVPLNGHGNIKYIPDYLKTINYNYDNVIIMYDRGRSNGTQITDNNRKAIPRVVKRLKKEYTTIKIYIFSPLCFESIPLSFSLLIHTFLSNYDIPENQYTKLHYELIDLLTNKITTINWLTYLRPGISIENIIEQAIEEITKNTTYQITHHPSKISDCWIKNCTTQCRTSDPHCNIINLSAHNLPILHKMELIAANSALGGLTYIMDKIYDNTHHRTYPSAIETDSPYKSMLIQEA